MMMQVKKKDYYAAAGSHGKAQSSEKNWQGIAVPGTAMGGENNTRGTDAHAT
jgi:hypothetical protein